MFGRTTRWLALMFAALAIVTFSQSVGYSQTGPPTDTDGDTTGGIEIDASGVLSKRVFQGNAQLLNRQRFAAAQASLNKDLQTPSKLRKISLTRLEKEVAQLVAANKQIPADMKYLAGMTRISNVFYYPESKDIVIAGPAEGYFITADNRVVGMKTGRSTMQLQDLIVALRCFTPDGKKTKVISCSIDPTQEGLAKFRDTVSASSAQRLRSRASSKKRLQAQLPRALCSVGFSSRTTSVFTSTMTKLRCSWLAMV